MSAVPSKTRRLQNRALALVDPVTRGWLIVTGGSLARLALGLVASVLIARALGPADLGVYAVLAATAGMVGVVSELGLTQAAVKRIAPLWPDSPDIVRERAQVFVWLRTITSLLVVVVAFIVGLPAVRSIAEIDPRLFALALAGVWVTAVSGAISGVLQALGRFARLTAVMLVNSLLTSLLALGLWYTGQLTLTSALAVLGIGTSLVSAVVGWRLLPHVRDWRIPSLSALRREGRPLFSFGIWLWLRSVLVVVATQADIVLVSHWLSPAGTGIYALAVNLAGKADVVNHSLYAVLLPSAASLTNRDAWRRYLRVGLVRSACIALLLIPLIVLARPVIRLFYGVEYAGAAWLFQLLLVVAIVEIFATPVLLLPFATSQPRLLAGAEAVRVAILILASIWLIPIYGAAGAIVARLIGRLGGLILTVFQLLRTRSEHDISTREPIVDPAPD